jgi:type I restriction enzyme R subunit
MVNKYIGADAVKQLIEPVNVFAIDEFEKEIDSIDGDAAKADAIASRVKKTITEKMEEDPALYRRFSDMIHETIEKFRHDRISEKEYLEQIKEIKQGVIEGSFADTPTRLKDKPEARSYYNTVKDEFDNYIVNRKTEAENGQIDPKVLNEMYVQAGIEIGQALNNLAIVDWTTNPDVKNDMFIAIEDYMIEFFRELDLKRDFDVIERIAETIIKSKQSYSSR